MKILKDLIVHASALLINIGTLTPDKVSYYKDAIALAKKHEVPIVLDPVGCHAGGLSFICGVRLD